MTITYSYPTDAAALDPILDLVEVQVSGTYDASATSITLESGEGAKLPSPATVGSFSPVWWDSAQGHPLNDPNAERVRVTARSGDVLTVSRGDGNTSASTKNAAGASYVMSLVVHSGHFHDIARCLPLNPKNPRFGAAMDGTTDDAAALQKVFDALPSTGGVVCLPIGTLAVGSAVTCSKPVRIVGASREGSKIKGLSNGFHALIFERSFELADLSLVRDNNSSSASWSGARLDFTSSTPVSGTRVRLKNVTVDGFDLGVYVDGGTGFDVESFVADNVSVDINSSATGGAAAFQPTIRAVRCLEARINGGRFTTTQTDTVENLSFNGCRRVIVDGPFVQRGIGVKVESILGRVALADIRAVEFDDTGEDVDVLADTNRIDKVRVVGCYSAGSRSISSDASVYVHTSGSTPSGYDVGILQLVENYWRDVAKKVLRINMGTGRTLECLKLEGNRYYNWSSGASQSGLNAVVNVESSGTVRAMIADEEFADGNSNGQSYQNFASVVTKSIGVIVESNVTASGQINNEGEERLRNTRVSNRIEVASGAQLLMPSGANLAINGIKASSTANMPPTITGKIPVKDSGGTVQGYLVVTVDPDSL